MFSSRHLDVELTLAYAGDAAELVLDGAGDAHETVGFHLGQTDNAVGFQRGSGQDQLLGDQGLVEADLYRSIEIGLLHADLPGRHCQAGFGCRSGRAAKARGISETDFGPGFLAQEAHGFEKGRVGRNVLLRLGAGQAIGFEEDPVFWRNESAYAAQAIAALAYGTKDPLRIIVRAFDQGDFGFLAMIVIIVRHGGGYSKSCWAGLLNSLSFPFLSTAAIA